MSWTIGIDFGTSRSAGAIAELDLRRLAPDAAGKRLSPLMAPSVSPLEIEGNRWIPSMVLLTPDGQLTVGAAADNLAGVHPDRLERTPKRSLGTPAPLLLGGEPVDPRDAAAAVIRTIVAEGRLRQGSDPAGCIITHPVRWAGVRRSALVDAAKRAGLETVELVDEPVAAAIHYASEHVEMGAHVGVYDLGGGTFDTALLQRTGGGFEVVGVPGGDENIGGEDFDHRLFRYFGQCLAEVDPDLWEQMMTSDDRKWKRAALDLLVQARRAKEALASYTSTQLFEPVADRDIVVNRSQFEAMIIDDVERTVDLMEETVLDAGMKVDDLAAIFLVGGSSRVPLVGQLVTERFGARVITRDEPKGVVALGAARLAALRFLLPKQPTGTAPAAATAPATAAPPPDASTAVTGIAPPPGTGAGAGIAPPPGTGAGAPTPATTDSAWLDALPAPNSQQRLGATPAQPAASQAPAPEPAPAPVAAWSAPPPPALTTVVPPRPLAPPAPAPAPAPTPTPTPAPAPATPAAPTPATAPTSSAPATQASVPLASVSVAWRIPLPDQPGQLTADVDGIAFGGLAGIVRLLHPITGRAQWQVSLQAPGWAAPALTADSVVYGAGDGRLFHLQRANGALRWQIHLGSPIIATPTVVGAMVVAGHDGSKLVGLDLTSGAVRWELPVGAAVRAGVVADGNDVVVCTTVGQVHLVDATTGQVKWSYRASGQILLTPAITADRVIVAAADGYVHGLRRTDGVALYGVRCTGNPATPVGVAGTVAAVVDDGPVLRVVRTDNGATVCEQPLGHGVPSGVALVPGTSPNTAIVETGGQLVAIDLTSRRTRFSVPTGDGNRSQPVAAGGIVAVATSFGQLYGIATV